MRSNCNQLCIALIFLERQSHLGCIHFAGNESTEPWKQLAMRYIDTISTSSKNKERSDLCYNWPWQFQIVCIELLLHIIRCNPCNVQNGLRPNLCGRPGVDDFLAWGHAHASGHNGLNLIYSVLINSKLYKPLRQNSTVCSLKHPEKVKSNVL